jgi:hypothetical protein
MYHDIDLPNGFLFHAFRSALEAWRWQVTAYIGKGSRPESGEELYNCRGELPSLIVCCFLNLGMFDVYLLLSHSGDQIRCLGENIDREI